MHFKNFSKKNHIASTLKPFNNMVISFLFAEPIELVILNCKRILHLACGHFGKTFASQ